jgi:hypothetical protein
MDDVAGLMNGCNVILILGDLVDPLIIEDGVILDIDGLGISGNAADGISGGDIIVPRGDGDIPAAFAGIIGKGMLIVFTSADSGLSESLRRSLRLGLRSG